MAINLNMEKAYDRLEWDLIRKSFQNLGSLMVRLIVQCNVLLLHRVIVNGKVGYSFSLKEA